MRHPALFYLLVFGCISMGADVSSAQNLPGHSTPSYDQVQPLLSKYCTRCHGTFKKSAGINLNTFKTSEAFQGNPPLLEKLLQQVRENAMPPMDKPQPSEDERDLLVAFFGHTYDSIDFEALGKNPGRVLIHRLSRTEYNNTVRDLFG